MDEGSRSSDETFVLLHGEPTWGYIYRNLIPGLSAIGRVIVPDHMGFGKSETPQDRDYSVLGFLDTRPHTTYLAHVRNPNLKVPGPANESGERLEGYYDKPLSAREYDAAAHSDDHPDKKGHEKYGHKEDSKEKP